VGPLLRSAGRSLAGALGRRGAGEAGEAGVVDVAGGRSGGHELEFILRSLVELKLQIEELRRRVDEDRVARNEWLGEVQPSGYSQNGMLMPGDEARVQGGDASPNVVMVTPGMRMEEIERLVIQAALRETRGNRRKAADMLGIGERTLYRKLKEYRLPQEGMA
jgi:DNA-binding NtrC family response regulator